MTLRWSICCLAPVRLATRPSRSTGHIRILGIGLELACNGGSCGEVGVGGLSVNRDKCHLHLKRLPACASVASDAPKTNGRGKTGFQENDWPLIKRCELSRPRNSARSFEHNFLIIWDYDQPKINARRCLVPIDRYNVLAFAVSSDDYIRSNVMEFSNVILFFILFSNVISFWCFNPLLSFSTVIQCIFNIVTSFAGYFWVR